MIDMESSAQNTCCHDYCTIARVCTMKVIMTSTWHSWSVLIYKVFSSHIYNVGPTLGQRCKANKHHILLQDFLNVGLMLAQHWTNIRPTYQLLVGQTLA